jgi:hypothetical protein
MQMAEWFQLPNKFLRDQRGKRLARLLDNRDAARWIPVHLLAFCTENETEYLTGLPDDIALADALDYEGDAAQLRRALIESGYLSKDGMCVVDWRGIVGDKLERSTAQRRDAANKRWGKKPENASPCTPSDSEREEETKTRLEETILGRIAPACGPHTDRTKAQGGDVSVLALEVQVTATTIYEAYPRKLARLDALKAIEKAMKDCPPTRLLDRTKAFAKATSKWNEYDRANFIPHATTWFNRGSYDDDPASWVKSYGGQNQVPATTEAEHLENGF